MKLKNIFLIFLIIISTCAFSQTKESYIRKGNELYKNGKFSDAEVNYLKSIQKNKLYNKGLFNLGDAYYKQKNYDKAGSAFQEYGSAVQDKAAKSNAMYNLGNTLFQSGKFEEAVNAYKNALRYSPNDGDTKYNLSMAMRMLKQQQQQKQDNKDNKDKKDQNKDQQKQQQQKQEQQKQEKQQQQQAKQEDKKLSKQDAERMLQALNKDEKDLQKKLEKKTIQVSNIKIDKNW